MAAFHNHATFAAVSATPTKLARARNKDNPRLLPEAHWTKPCAQRRARADSSSRKAAPDENAEPRFGMIRRGFLAVSARSDQETDCSRRSCSPSLESRACRRQSAGSQQGRSPEQIREHRTEA